MIVNQNFEHGKFLEKYFLQLKCKKKELVDFRVMRSVYRYLIVIVGTILPRHIWQRYGQH